MVLSSAALTLNLPPSTIARKDSKAQFFSFSPFFSWNKFLYRGLDSRHKIKEGGIAAHCTAGRRAEGGISSRKIGSMTMTMCSTKTRSHLAKRGQSSMCNLISCHVTTLPQRTDRAADSGAHRMSPGVVRDQNKCTIEMSVENCLTFRSRAS